jgi:hypothetical protein
MVLKVTIDDKLYKELKNYAKSQNQFIMGYCDKLFTEKVEEILKQALKKGQSNEK